MPTISAAALAALGCAGARRREDDDDGGDAVCDKRLGRRKNKTKQISVLALIAEPFAAGPLNACKASPADARWVFPAGGGAQKSTAVTCVAPSIPMQSALATSVKQQPKVLLRHQPVVSSKR